MKRPSLGTGNRYASDLGGNHIERLRREANPGGINVDIRFNLRFCETCRLHKPKGTRPAKKGWKCDDCRMEAKKGVAS